MHCIMGWQRVANTCECCTDPDANCPIEPCLTTSCNYSPPPVSCTFTGYSWTNHTGGGDCDGICTDLIITTEASVRASYCDPMWCSCPTDACWCYGDISDVGYYSICDHGGCTTCYSGDIHHDPDQPDFQESSFCDSNWTVKVSSPSGIVSPTTEIGDTDFESIYNAFSVSYSAAAMGSYMLTSGGQDLCAVYGYATVDVLTIVYVYETGGGCRKYCFEINDGLGYAESATATEHVSCVNAQTTGSSIYDLGLTATGGSSNLMYAPNDVPNVGEWVRLDTGGSVVVKSYSPPKVWWEWNAYMEPDPVSCNFPVDCEDIYWEMISDTKQRITSGAWDDAYCPYNYSWSISHIGENLLSISCEMSS